MLSHGVPDFPSILTFNFFINREAAPGALLLLFQGLLAGGKILDMGHIRQGIVTPVNITWESIVFTLHDTP